MPAVRRSPSFSAVLPIALLLLALLTGCRTATDLVYEPKPDDPLDGYAGSLAQAGINTEMDWGPKQNLLLSEFKTLKEQHTSLERRLDDLLAENQNLKTQLNNEGVSLQKEKALRVQAEAETDLLRQRVREREARILSLSIEKAKLEQQTLLGKIDALRLALEPPAAGVLDAAAKPPAGRQ
jgi:hypothetical protein